MRISWPSNARKDTCVSCVEGLLADFFQSHIQNASSSRTSLAAIRNSISYGNFQDSIISRELYRSDIDGQAAFNCFIEVVKQLLKGLTLGCASGNAWHFSPETTFFCFVHDNFDFHGSHYTATAQDRRANRQTFAASAVFRRLSRRVIRPAVLPAGGRASYLLQRALSALH